MTRALVYALAAVAFAAAMAMTLSSVILPRWISWDSSVPGGHILYTYGLHRKCSSVTGQCVPFPSDAECHTYDRDFCSVWKSAGFLMSFAILLEGVIGIMYFSILAGGRKLREEGWKPLAVALLLCSIAQCASMALMAFLFDTDDRFFPGWKLDTSFILCTISWSICFLLAGIIALAGRLLPPEGGYELIPN